MHVVLRGGVAVTLGLAPRQADLMKGTTGFVGGRVGDDSIWAVLHRECHVLFSDELFSDLFTSTGRRSVPPRIVAVVMVLQRWLGLSDREAVQAFEFDARWKYACGGLDFDYPGFVHTVLVDMRARLARSERPKRIFEVTLEAARVAGVVSAKRVLDSTPLYDAVATQDSVTMIRSAIRQLLAAADPVLEIELRAVLGRDDDYASGGKPTCDWDDPGAREELVAELAVDGYACLEVLEDRDLTDAAAEVAALLATVLGQDLERGEDNRFRIARRVAKDRVISTVDPDARHGHKTSARGFDGYKGHVAVDPDSEIITDTTVTPGNAGDASVAEDLIDDLLDDENRSDDATVYGDSAYGAGEFQQRLDDEHITSGCRTQPPAAPAGKFGKDRFDVDLDADTVTCPNNVTVSIRRGVHGDGTAYFAEHCTGCPARGGCTDAAGGRTIRVGVFEAALARARQRQADPAWQADYRANRPKVERKLGHLMRRRHGGRRARVRGRPKVDADFNLLAAAANLARLAVLRLRSTPTGWAITT
ncbi:MAG: IS1182 family transposase [Actinobacteria bacterium]|nr:IS1182 family transposase [Actinomycetota bacterium]